MKKWLLPVIFAFTTLLSGCVCECDDDYPTLTIQFEGFTAAELKTVYVVNPATPDPCFSCIVFTENSAIIGVSPNTQYQLKSDSIALNRVIQVNEIRTETAKFSACDCTYITGIDYELAGDKYTDEPIVITK